MAEQEQTVSARVSLEVASPDGKVLETDAEYVVLPGVAGQLTIFPDHFPLITRLNIGIVEYHDKDEAKYCFVRGGVAQVGNDRITVLSSASEDEVNIDYPRAQAALQRANEKRGSSTDEKELKRYSGSLSRAEARLEIEALVKQRREDQL
jgi:F-type H+-transporting ATPase subunit epsilon